MITRPQPISSRSRLAPDALLWGNAGACLPQRFAGVECTQCTDECPADVLSITTNGFELAPGCTNCGRCAATCPTRALSLGQFQFAPPTDADDTIHVECRKVPESLSLESSLRVPCTGALATSQWLALVNASDGKGVVVIDRGWCATCSAGGQDHPAEQRMLDANTLLGKMGVPAEQHIRFNERALPVDLCPDTIPEPGSQSEVSRRGFLRQLVGHAAMATRSPDLPETIGEVRRRDGHDRILPAERLAILSELRQVGELTGQPLPASLFHSIFIDSTCCNHQVCAKACPVAALGVHNDGTTTGVDFDAALCIGCGACADHCPEHALQLSPGTGAPQAEMRVPLTRHQSLRCFDCGAAMIASNKVSSMASDHDAPVCPSCRKSKELGRSLFGDLFSTH